MWRHDTQNKKKATRPKLFKIFLSGLEWQSEPTAQQRSRFVCVKMAKDDAKQLPVIMYRQVQEKGQRKNPVGYFEKESKSGTAGTREGNQTSEEGRG